MSTTREQDNYHRPGLALIPWTRAAGISKQTFYNLDDESRPESVKIGNKNIVIESAAAWHARMRARGGAITITPPHALRRMAKREGAKRKATKGREAVFRRNREGGKAA